MNYTDVNDSEIAFLYRESHAYGNANQEGVTIDTFFTAASECGFFIKHLKFQALVKYPKFDSDNKLSYGQDNIAFASFLKACEKVNCGRGLVCISTSY